MRQTPIHDLQGSPGARLTTLSHDYADDYVVPEHFHREHQLVFAAKGYNSPSAFISAFKKALGQTPGKYAAN